MLAVLHKQDLRLELEFEEASRIASALAKRILADTLRAAIADVHTPRGRSQGVQAILREDLEQLGFTNERSGLFADMAKGLYAFEHALLMCS